MDAISLALGILIGALSSFIFLFLSLLIVYTNKKNKDRELQEKILKDQADLDKKVKELGLWDVFKGSDEKK